MRTGVLLAVVAAALCQTSLGEAIVSYTDGPATPTAVAGVVASAIAPAPAVNGQETIVLTRVTNAYYASQPFFTAARANTVESGTPGNVYFTVTVSAAAGHELDLQSLTFKANRGGGSTPRTYDVRSSVDNFATSLTGGAVAIPTARPASASPATATEWTHVSVDLRGPAFQNLPSITLLFYINTPTVSQNIDFDDVKVNGTVSAIP